MPRLKTRRAAVRLLRQAHTWIGLIAAVFLLVMAASGCVILFRHQIEHLYAPKIAAHPVELKPAGLSVVARQVTLFFPDATITRIEFPETAAEPLLLYARNHRKDTVQLYCDPYSGAVLGAKQGPAWLDWTVDLHRNLLLGKTGRSIAGVTGILLLLLSLSGLFSWLAGPRDWKRSLALPRPGPFRLVSYQVHRWAGLWLNGLLAIVASTGIALAYPDTLRQFADSFGAQTKPPKAAFSTPVTRRALLRNSRKTGTVSGVPLQGQRCSFPDWRHAAVPFALRPLEDYVASARRAVPDGEVRELRLPAGAGLPVTVVLRTPNDLRPRGTTLVSLDPSSAAELAVERAAGRKPSARLRELITLIHFVEWGGWPAKLAWCLIGSSPILLSVSGLSIWWNRRRRPSQATSPDQTRS